MRRRSALLALLAALLAAAAAYPTAASASGDNAAVAINTKDNSSKFQFKFSLRNEAGDVVDNANAAYAYASCAYCDSTAIAIQIVLVSSHPSTFTPTNVSLSLNDQCSFCLTFSYAYQIVRQTDGPVRFTGTGHHQLNAIKHQIDDLKKQALTPDDLNTQLDAYVAQIKTILDTQLVPRGPGEPSNPPAPFTDTASVPATGPQPAGEYTGGAQAFMGGLAAATTP